jgi:hypothetical protein
MNGDDSAKRRSILESILVPAILIMTLIAIIAAVALSSPGSYNPIYHSCWVTPSSDQNDPASLNTSLTLHLANRRPVFGTGEAVRTTVTDVKRGNSALIALQNSGHPNADPGPGKEFLLVQVKYENLQLPARGMDTSDLYINMNLVQSDNSSATKDANDTISPTFPVAVIIPPGGSVEGYITFIINLGDLAPKFTYDPKELGGKCPTFWFALN